MTDFLRANPFVTMEQYKWELTIPQIRIMASDTTHIDYSRKRKESKKPMEEENVVYINTLEDVQRLYGDSIV